MLPGKNISALCLKPDVVLEIGGRHPRLASLPGLGGGLLGSQGGGHLAAPHSLPPRRWAPGPCAGAVSRDGNPGERGGKGSPNATPPTLPRPPLSPQTSFLGGGTGLIRAPEAESSPCPPLPWALPGINIPLGL